MFLSLTFSLWLCVCVGVCVSLLLELFVRCPVYARSVAKRIVISNEHYHHIIIVIVIWMLFAVRIFSFSHHNSQKSLYCFSIGRCSLSTATQMKISECYSNCENMRVGKITAVFSIHVHCCLQYLHWMQCFWTRKISMVLFFFVRFFFLFLNVCSRIGMICHRETMLYR